MATVQTTSGPVVGLDNGGVQVFKGIPYAEPPVGDRRWRPPVARTPWTEPLECFHTGKLAAQNASPLEGMLGGGAPPIGDDCLSLNVWTPAADDARRPVLFWIHGGAFVTGTGATPWYDGSQFASQHDVVVVTINYRLPALGFLHLGDIAESAGGDSKDWEGSGNAGILDQAFALGWVNENIAAFGGDPGNVTIFGESAGGMSVGTQLGLPASKGLFRRAIAQSGAAGNVHAREAATNAARAFLAEVGVGEDELHRLRELPVEEILRAQDVVNAARGNATGGLPFMPCADGVTLPVPPMDAVASGSSAGVDLLIGTNLDEMTLFTMMDPRLASLDDAGLVKLFGTIFGADRAADAVDTYRKDRGGATHGALWNAALADRVFRAPAVRLADAQSAHANAYVYLFTWASTAFDGRLGSTHALEIPFVFDNLDATGVSFLTGDITEEMRDLAAWMHASWASFARTGDPGAGWQRWDATTRPTTVIAGDRQEVELDPSGHELSLWL
ncbi:MAG TPA: carboxylesterase/lipase family protein [Acidimicrobiales bacterium]|nr:carboxylesterase/lipase family protein [Acidimicrobiales bacterium]